MLVWSSVARPLKPLTRPETTAGLRARKSWTCPDLVDTRVRDCEGEPACVRSDRDSDTRVSHAGVDSCNSHRCNERGPSGPDRALPTRALGAAPSSAAQRNSRPPRYPNSRLSDSCCSLGHAARAARDTPYSHTALRDPNDAPRPVGGAAGGAPG